MQQNNLVSHPNLTHTEVIKFRLNILEFSSFVYEYEPDQQISKISLLNHFEASVQKSGSVQTTDKVLLEKNWTSRLTKQYP